MAANDELNFIDIADFTPGITSAYLTADGPQPNPGPGEAPSSAAQVRDTYGCYGHPNGGLHPLPGTVEEITENRDTPTAGYSAVGNTDYLIATHVMSPVYGPVLSRASTQPAIPATPDLISVIYQTIERRNDGGDEQLKFRIVQYRQGSNPQTRIVLASWDDDFTSRVLMSANVTKVTTGTIYDENTNTYQGYTTDDGDVVPGHQPGRVGLIYNVNAGIAGNEGRAFIWPRIHLRLNGEGESAGVTSDTAYRLYPLVSLLVQNPGAFPGYLALSHQNRYVWCKQSYLPNPLYAPFLPIGEAGIKLGSDSQYGSGDFWRYTPPNDLAGEGKGPSSVDGQNTYPAFEPTATRFGQATAGFGAAISMNASELFLVKQEGGGTIVRGNLDAPNVTDYPGIPSTKGAACKPAVGPMGMIYGTVNGVYAWSGADQVQNLSPQLDGWFWKPEDGSTSRNEFNASHGQFLYHHPFLLAPNNWVMDSRTGGWFRLVDPDEIVFKDYNASALEHFYAHPGRLTVDGGVIAARFDMRTGQHRYSWRSQPLPTTRNRTLRFREVNIVAQGQGTITVTIHGLNGATSSATFTVDSVHPIAQTAVVAVDTHDAEVQVEAQGLLSDPSSPAPILYRMSVGHQQGNTVGIQAPSEPDLLVADLTPPIPVTQVAPLSAQLEDLFDQLFAAGGTITGMRWIELDIECIDDATGDSYVTVTLEGGTGGEAGAWLNGTVPGRDTSTSTLARRELGRTVALTATTPPFNEAAGSQTVRFTPTTPTAYATDGSTPLPRLDVEAFGAATYRITGIRGSFDTDYS